MNCACRRSYCLSVGERQFLKFVFFFSIFEILGDGYGPKTECFFMRHPVEQVRGAEVTGCQYVVVINVNVKNWMWSKSVGSAGRDELCEEVTWVPNCAAHGFAGVELVRERWKGWSFGAASKAPVTGMEGWVKPF